MPAVHERAGFLQLFENGFVGVENIHTREKGNSRQEDSGVVHGRQDIQIVLQAHFVVIGAVAGSGVNAAGT